jgi:peptidyl-prolyl cis-trans isomerase SurA
VKHPNMALLAAAALVGLAGVARAELVDRVAAVVDEQIITLSEVEQRAAPELRQAFNERDPSKRNALRKAALEGALEGLIAEKLLEREMDELGIAVTDQEVELGIEDVRRQNNFTPEQFAQALAQEGYSVAGYKQFMKKHLRRMKLLNLKVRSRVKVSDKDLKAEYDRWARLEQADPEVHARHILVRVARDAPAKEVEEALARARAIAEEARKPGADFAQLAREKSEGPSREDGGDLGFFKRGMMLPDFDKVAFHLPEGAVSDPVRTHFGFHVIKVEARRNQPVASFEEMKPQLQENVLRNQQERFTEQYVKELRQKARVEIRI